MGSLMLASFEGDVEKAFTDLATDSSEYMTWFRARVRDVTGVDLGTPSDDPLLRSSSTIAPDRRRRAHRRPRLATTARSVAQPQEMGRPEILRAANNRWISLVPSLYSPRWSVESDVCREL